MAAGVLEGLGDDHVAWLMVAAHNELCQRRPDRAATLLELLDVVHPDNLQCRMLLAYAYWLGGDATRAGAVLDRIPRQETAAAQGAAIELLRAAAGGDAP